MEAKFFELFEKAKSLHPYLDLSIRYFKVDGWEIRILDRDRKIRCLFSKENQDLGKLMAKASLELGKLIEKEESVN